MELLSKLVLTVKYYFENEIKRILKTPKQMVLDQNKKYKIWIIKGKTLYRKLTVTWINQHVKSLFCMVSTDVSFRVFFSTEGKATQHHRELFKGPFQKKLLHLCAFAIDKIVLYKKEKRNNCTQI